MEAYLAEVMRGSAKAYLLVERRILLASWLNLLRSYWN